MRGRLVSRGRRSTLLLFVCLFGALVFIVSQTQIFRIHRDRPRLDASAIGDGGDDDDEEDEDDSDSAEWRDHDRPLSRAGGAELTATSVRRGGRAFTWARDEMSLDGAASILRRVQRSGDIKVSASSRAETSRVDAIVILCGGSGLPLWVKERLLAAKLMHDAARAALIASVDHDSTQSVLHNDSRLPIIVVSGGGSPHVGPTVVEEAGVPHTLHEATEACIYLRDVLGFQGVIMKEISSYDTIGNAYFTRQLFADPQRWRRAIIVTSDWHMARTILLFQYIFALQPRNPTQLFYTATPPGATAETLKKRLEVEERNLDAMKRSLLTRGEYLDTVGDVRRTLVDFQRWLFTQHRCYDERGPRETAIRRPEDNALY